MAQYGFFYASEILLPIDLLDLVQKFINGLGTEYKLAFERLGYHTYVDELAKKASNAQTLCDAQVT